MSLFYIRERLGCQGPVSSLYEATLLQPFCTLAQQDSCSTLPNTSSCPPAAPRTPYCPPSRSPRSLSPSTRWGNEGGQMCRQRVLVQQRSMDLTEQLSVRSWKPSTAALHLATVMGRPRRTLSQPFYRLWNSLERRMKLRSQPASSLACLKVLRVVNARPQVHLPCQGVHPHSRILDGNDTCTPLHETLKWFMLSNAFYLALSNLPLSVICGHVTSERVKQSL